MRRLVLLAVLAVLAAALVAPPAHAGRRWNGPAAAVGAVASDPFDRVARRTAKGEPIYRDSNHDGVIRPDAGRTARRHMDVTGADEVVLLHPQSAATATAEGGASGSRAAAADCWRKYGVASAEAYWWSPSGIKYTFRWVFGVDFRYAGCTGVGAVGSRYSAQLIAKRLDAATPAYLRNDNAYWEYWDPGWPNNNCQIIDCRIILGPRNFGAAYYADGEKVYLGNEHPMWGSSYYSSSSNTLRADFTAPSPDHTTNVYFGCSQITSDRGGIAFWVAC
jgi:hypothetical protein